ncbi:adenine nucleotide alpha hydrolase [Porticoccus sp.]|uniref:adenine nucleotide alpha hydrolase n=1 Tax=Porticoccus sp. TaxID=2024853 RepID=UPI0025FA9AC1|nr:adenine nucleotide alpha hydrolase [Porticoccus sp.]
MTDLSRPGKTRVLLSWSSGKDSAWTLYQLQRDPTVEVVGLLTTYNQAFARSAIHGVRLTLVRAQAQAAGLPLVEIPLPWPCSNEQYEQAMRAGLDEAMQRFVPDAIAFGDLFLEDIRAYRESRMAQTGLDVLFPIWGTPTDQLALTMISGGLQAAVTCLDPARMPQSLAGAAFDLDFLAKLPATVDPCGENGEFHSFAWSGPMFKWPIRVAVGETVIREGFVYTDLTAVVA